MVEDSSKNHRDFFSVIFVHYLDLKHHPRNGVEGLRRKAPRPKFMSFFLILSQFVCLLESGPQKPAAYRLLTVSCFQVFTLSSFIPHEVRVVFVFPLL